MGGRLVGRGSRSSSTEKDAHAPLTIRERPRPVGLTARSLADEMPKIAKELGALAVSRLSMPGTHAVGRVAGLALQITPSGARSWVLRAMVGGRRREIGLGAYPGVSLKEAQEKA